MLHKSLKNEVKFQLKLLDNLGETIVCYLVLRFEIQILEL